MVSINQELVKMNFTGVVHPRMETRLGSSSSTLILWQSNQANHDLKTARKSSKVGKNNGNISDHNSYNDADGPYREGYENLAFSQDDSNAPLENTYSTIGDESTYETVSSFSDLKNAEPKVKGGSHVYDVETTGTQDISNEAGSTEGGSCSVHIYDRAEENMSLPSESVKPSQSSEELHDSVDNAIKDEGTNDIEGNIYDRAEGYEGQPLTKPKGTSLSDEFSKRVLSNTLKRNSEEKSLNVSYEDDDYDSPEDIIMD